MQVGIATDHGGFGLNEDLVARRRAAGHFSAEQGVEDDHMNIICIGGRTVGSGVAWDLVQAFLAAEFRQAPRHLRRSSKVASLQRFSHVCRRRASARRSAGLKAGRYTDVKRALELQPARTNR